MPFRYFEDFRPGEVLALGQYKVTAPAIIAFAEQFDPQYFHTDPARAQDSTFGGLVASGWHTCSIYMRLLVDGLLREAASLASPGVEDIRWLRPVRPEDVLAGRLTVLEVRPSRHHAGRGNVKHLGELHNQRGELVMSLRTFSIIGGRPKQGAA